MKLLKNLNGNHCLMAIAVIALLYSLSCYSAEKELNIDGMQKLHPSAYPSDDNSMPSMENGDSAPKEGGCNSSQSLAPSDLLPSGNEGNLVNNTDGLGQVNFLQAGSHIGQVSQTMRNPNLQLRAEPTIQQSSVGPWNNSTIAGDTNESGKQNVYCGA